MPSPARTSSRVASLNGLAGSVTLARRWVIIGLLFTSALINYLDRATLSVALPMISSDFRLTYVQKGFLLWSFFASYALLQPPVGWLVDRANLKWLYAGMYTLWCFSCGLMGLAGSLAMLVGLRILLGIGESIYLPGGNRIVSVLFPPEERGFPSGLYDCGTRAGLALGAPLIAWLIVRYGWRKMFFLVGFSALLWLLPWLVAFPSQRLSSQGAVLPPPTPGGGKRILTYNRNLLGLSLGFFCFGYFWYLLVTWLPDYLMQVRHLPVLKAGIYAALPFFVFGASSPFGGWTADRLVRRGWDETRTRKGMITLAFFMGLLLIPAARVETGNSAILLVAGASLVGLASGNILALMQSCAPNAEVGAWTGVQNCVGNLGGISALVTGVLISRTGSYTPAFVLGVAILLIGLLSYWFIVGRLPTGTAQGPLAEK